jgi:hypothetical protein
MTNCTTTGLIKTAILDRLQCWKKTKFWGCSVGILPLGWIPKSWTTLPAFRWLLIQPQRTNSLEDTEFCASAKLLKIDLDSTTVGRNKIPKIKQTETPGLPNTISISSSLCFPMLHFITPNGQWITSYSYQRMARWLNRGKLSGLDLPTQISIWQNFVITFLETWISKLSIMNSDFRWLLIWPIPMHGLVTMGFWSQDEVLKTFWTNCADRRTIRF